MPGGMSPTGSVVESGAKWYQVQISTFSMTLRGDWPARFLFSRCLLYFTQPACDPASPRAPVGTGCGAAITAFGVAGAFHSCIKAPFDLRRSVSPTKLTNLWYPLAPSCYFEDARGFPRVLTIGSSIIMRISGKFSDDVLDQRGFV
jgi:hypothetical protein